MSNIVSLKAYKTIKECQRLFVGYEAKLSTLDNVGLVAEAARYRKEAAEFPFHLLTLVKGQLLMSILSEKAVSSDLKEYATNETVRLKAEINRRLTEL